MNDLIANVVVPEEKTLKDWLLEDVKRAFQRKDRHSG